MLGNYEKVVDGSIVTYNDFGDAIATRPVPISDDDIITSGPFAGWTVRQQAAYWAAQGATLITQPVAATAVAGDDGVVTYDADVLEADQAKLRAEAQTDPVVLAALEELKTGAFGIDEAALAAEAAAAAEAQLEQEAQDAAAHIIAAGGGFSDTYPGGGELTTAEYMELYKQIVRASVAGEISGVDIEDAVTQGVLTREQADQMLEPFAAGNVNARKPSTPAAEVYLVGGQYVDKAGVVVPPAVLKALGLGPLETSDDASASVTPSRAAVAGDGFPWLLALAGAAGVFALSRR